MIGPGTIPVQVKRSKVQQHSIDSHFSIIHCSYDRSPKSRMPNSCATSSQNFMWTFHRAAAVKGYQVLSCQWGNFSNCNAAEERARQLSQAGFPGIIMEK